jgi:ligand-binding sensor domain-containing protein
MLPDITERVRVGSRPDGSVLEAPTLRMGSLEMIGTALTGIYSRRSDRGPLLSRVLGFLLVTLSGGWGAAGAIVPSSLEAQSLPEVRVVELADEVFVARRWNARNGLPVNQVTGLTQGSDGYLWLTTLDGLVRFDGVQFTLFNKALTPDLPSARFSRYLGEWQGGFWLESEARHLVWFKDGDFVDHTPDLGSQFMALHIGDDAVWVGADDGLYVLNGARFERVHEVGRAAVTAVREDRIGALWVARENGDLERWDRTSLQILERYPPRVPGREPILLLEEDVWGATWGASFWGTVRIAGGQRVEQTLEGSWGLPSRLIPPDGEGLGTLTLGFGDSYAFVLEGARWEPVTPERMQAGSLTAAFSASGGHWSLAGGRLWWEGRPFTTGIGGVNTVVVDHEGSLWAAGVEGLLQVRPASVQGIRLQDEGVAHHAYTLHEGPTGTVWIAALGAGLRRTLWRLKDGQPELMLSHRTAVLPSPLEMGVLEDREGALWVALEGGGVCRLVALRCSEANWTRMDGALVRGLFEASDGTLWFGTVSGVRGRRPDGSWFSLDDEPGMPAAAVRVFAEAPDGALWMGTTSEGILRWDGTSVERLSLAEGLSSVAVRALHIDPTGTVWVGTEGRGVSVVRGRAATGAGAGGRDIRTIRERDGLFDDGVHQILEDDRGRLWMSSNRGLFHVQRSELEAFLNGVVSSVRSAQYDERDGLLNR